MLDFQAARWLVKGEVAQAGRQQSSDQHSDRRVQDRRRPYQHRRPPGRRSGSGSARRSGARDLVARPRIRHRGKRARRTATPSMPRSSGAPSSARSADWVERFNAAGVPCGPIYAIDQMFADPQVKHLGMAQTGRRTEHGPLTLVGQPVSLSRTPSRLAAPPPEPRRAHRRGARRNSVSAPRRSRPLRRAEPSERRRRPRS